jgi:hypothetical protein
MLGTILLGLATLPFVVCGGWFFLAQRTRAQTSAKIAALDNQLFPAYEFSSLYTIRYPRVLNDVDLRGQYLNEFENDGSHFLGCQFTPYGDDTPIPVLCVCVLTLPDEAQVTGPEEGLAFGGLPMLARQRGMTIVDSSPVTTLSGQEFKFQRVDFTAELNGGPIYGFLLGVLDYGRLLQIYGLSREPPDSEMYRLLEASATTLARKKY